jgi:hypothetical protein
MTDYWYKFDGNELIPRTSDLVADEELDQDWTAALQKLGFKVIVQVPEEVALVEITIWARQSEPRFLVELMMSGTGIMGILCNTAPLMLSCVRTQLLPLFELNRVELETECINKAVEILFDEQDGLECAQRVLGRERERLRRLAAERNRKAK